jgi:DNA helicase II / ATP-dependent DNA helicase PcrA
MSDREGLEEERRLMYVAITRARKRLYLSHSQTRMLHGQTRYNLKSRFFEELPEGCLKWLTPKVATWVGEPAAAGGWQSGRRGAYAGGGARSTGPSPAWTPGWLNEGAVSKAPEPDRGVDIRSGQKVFHTKFGEGKVLALEGAGADARAQVNFSRHGVKWLALSVAKLTPVDE